MIKFAVRLSAMSLSKISTFGLENLAYLIGAYGCSGAVAGINRALKGWAATAEPGRTTRARNPIDSWQWIEDDIKAAAREAQVRTAQAQPQPRKRCKR